MTIRQDGFTFACEKRDDGTVWLCVVDVHGVSAPIAHFVDPACVAQFKNTLNLAKMASHAHGASGI